MFVDRIWTHAAGDSFNQKIEQTVTPVEGKFLQKLADPSDRQDSPWMYNWRRSKEDGYYGVGSCLAALAGRQFFCPLAKSGANFIVFRKIGSQNVSHNPSNSRFHQSNPLEESGQKRNRPQTHNQNI